MGLGAHEAISPDMVGPLRTQSHIRPVVEPQPASRFLLLGTFSPSRHQIRSTRSLPGRSNPQSPRQRVSNENANGLLRQYFRKKIDLSGYSQSDLDKVAMRPNQPPRKTLGFELPQVNFKPVLHRSIETTLQSRWTHPAGRSVRLRIFQPESERAVLVCYRGKRSKQNLQIHQ